MSTKERKKREKEQRRNRIIDAAERVVFKQGQEAATMDEIAVEADLSKGTLYLYFKNKNELCMAICERGSNLLTARFKKVFSEDRSGLELVRGMGEAYLGFVRENPDYFNMFMFYEMHQKLDDAEKSRWEQTCQQNIKEAINLMVHALKIGMQDGSVNDAYDPKELAVLIWASTKGIVSVNHMKKAGHFKIIDEIQINTESLFSNYLHLIGAGISSNKK